MVVVVVVVAVVAVVALVAAVVEPIALEVGSELDALDGWSISQSNLKALDMKAEACINMLLFGLTESFQTFDETEHPQAKQKTHRTCFLRNPPQKNPPQKQCLLRLQSSQAPGAMLLKH